MSSLKISFHCADRRSLSAPSEVFVRSAQVTRYSSRRARNAASLPPNSASQVLSRNPPK